MSTSTEKTFAQKFFELDKRINYALIAGGLGVAAVGAAMGAPAFIQYGGLAIGGSIAGLEASKKVKDLYEKRRAKKIGANVTQREFAPAA